VRTDRIVFLDIDGVLNNSSRSEFCGTRTRADPLNVLALQEILKRTGAFIVVSSSWRFEGLGYCAECLRSWGIHAPLVDVTPLDTDVLNTRGKQIAEWLRWYSDRVKSYVILDDYAGDDMDIQRLVQTKFEEGLTMAHMKRAVEILGRDLA
jgi:hypothetical protein